MLTTLNFLVMAGLVVVGTVLFVLVRSGRIDSRTITTAAEVATIVSLIAAVLVFVLPSPSAHKDPGPVAQTSTHTLTSTPTLSPTSTPTLTWNPEATPGVGSTRTREADGMEMVYVPSGSFQMGSEQKRSEMPVRTVMLDEFWLDRTEVTNVQYLECVAAGACMSSEYADGTARNSMTDLPLHTPEQPVVGVSWFSAVDYCEWVGARLPTEAEWEYAARGPKGREYPWGDATPTCELANYKGHYQSGASGYGVGASAPVGSYPHGASWVGALDLAGNVSEWVADWYGEYPATSETNPTGPYNGERRVIRSAAWYHIEGLVRSTKRSGMDPTFTGSAGTGFRCAGGAPGD